MRILLLSLALTGAAIARAAAPLEIVLPAQATRIERFAADELRHHLMRAQDAAVTLADEASPRATGVRRLFVGRTRAAQERGFLQTPFADEEHLVAGVGGDLYFLGGDRDTPDGTLPFGDRSGRLCCGSLYAVYDFLEREMGVAWIWPGELGEVIPRRDVPVCDGLRRRACEPLVLRGFGGEPDTEKVPAGGKMQGWANIENARKDVANRRLWLVRHRIGARRTFNGSHAFTDWWPRYGKDHPEFFNLLPNGRRTPLEGDEKGRNVTLCVSNPDLHREIVRRWRTSGKAKPKPYYTPCVNVCENDTPGLCTCANCRAWDAPDPRFAQNVYWRGDPSCPLKNQGRFVRLADVQWGETADSQAVEQLPSLSDRYLKFYNAVVAEARTFDPTAEAFGYAYANYRAAPRQTRVADGVIISFVPRMFFPYTASESDLFRRDWAGWRAAGARQMIYRPNYMLAGANLPYNTAPRIADDIAFAATNGMMAISQDSLIGVWSAQAIQNYTITRLMREPTAGYARALGEFAAAFGPAADEIRAYCRFLATVGEGFSVADWQTLGHRNRGPHNLIGGGFKNFVLVAADLYPAGWFERAKAILDGAAAKVCGAADGLAARRIDFLKKGLEDARLTVRVRAIQKSGDSAAFRAALKELDAYRASVEADGVCEYYWTASREASGAGWFRKNR